MDKANEVLSAALTRPLNVLAPVAGLAFALVFGPWWFFPLSLVPYALMVFFTLRDRRFVASTLARKNAGAESDAIDWRGIARSSGSPSRRALIERLARSERKLSSEVSTAPAESRALMESCLAQVRSAARLGVDLLRRAADIERALASGTDPARSRGEAGRLRRQAELSHDAESRVEWQAAATALEEGATHTEALVTMRERTLAQLENLAASLESASVRAVRLRIATGGDRGSAADITGALRIDVEAMRETLAAFEEAEDDPNVSTGQENFRKEAP